MQAGKLFWIFGKKPELEYSDVGHIFLKAVLGYV